MRDGAGAAAAVRASLEAAQAEAQRATEAKAAADALAGAQPFSSHVLWHGSSGSVFSDVQNQQQILVTTGWLAFCTGACFYRSVTCCLLTVFSEKKQSARP